MKTSRVLLLLLLMVVFVGAAMADDIDPSFAIGLYPSLNPALQPVDTTNLTTDAFSFLLCPSGCPAPAWGPSVNGLVTPWDWFDLRNETGSPISEIQISLFQPFPLAAPVNDFVCWSSIPTGWSCNVATTVGATGDTFTWTLTTSTAPIAIGQAFNLQADSSDSVNFETGEVYVAVPEPASLAVLGAGLLGIGGLLRRKLRK